MNTFKLSSVFLNGYHKDLHQGLRPPHFWLCLCAIALCFFSTMFSASSRAQPSDPTKLTVSYSYNFAKNILWPNENQLQVFTIALYGVDEGELSNEFMKLNNRVLVRGKPVSVFQTRNPQALLNANVVYVGNNQDLTQLQNLIGSRPILLVTRNATNKRLVMLNIFTDESLAYKFEVNKANLVNNQLTPLPELILLGGSEIDVAKLYREGQNSLVKLQNQLGAKQSQLTQLQQKNTEQERSNQRLINQMQTLNKDVDELNKLNSELSNKLVNLNQAIETSTAIIAQQKAEIAQKEQQQKKLVSEVDRRNQELEKKAIELEKKQNELTQISLSITNKEARLMRLNLTIDQQQAALEKQQRELEIQRNSISELDKLVSAQKWSLWFLAGLVLACLAFILLGVMAYLAKRRANDRLEKHGRELQLAKDKLEVAKRKAEAANRAKGAFLSLMSHELRTPLQSIIGYTDIVIEDLKADGDQIYSDQLIRVNTNGERLLQLINNTLDLAKIEAGKMDVQLTPTHVNTLIEEASNNIKPLLAKNKNTLVVDVDSEKYMPEIDHDKMLHMMVNLLSNATKFTKNGTITITIRNQPTLFKLIISDTGIGLNDQQKSEIFTRFHQVNSAKVKHSDGTGLGLSITQYFCEVMGGTIHAEDRIDFEHEKDPSKPKRKLQGSSFVVNIPLPVVIVDKKFAGLEDDEEIEEEVKMQDKKSKEVKDTKVNHAA